VRVEFHRPEDPQDVVGSADWDGRRAVVRADDDEVRAALERVFRPAPVVIDDASLRHLGASGESVVQPGGLEWFRAAAIVRSPEAGLVPRFVATAPAGAGWDPAANYRRFSEQVRRITTR
jgi:hypothetical protein